MKIVRTRAALFAAVSTIPFIIGTTHAESAGSAASSSAATGPNLANSQPAGGEASPQIEEIVVTAQKRQQSLNSVPMSIQAASGTQLERLGVVDTAGLQKIVPGFSATPSQYNTPVYTIRGIGFQDSSLAAGPTVSVYMDEVPLPFPIETFGTTLDLQRVEVLKGPQGTLFGENSTGGAVNFIENKPTDYFTAGADIGYGRFDTFNFNGFVSGPLTDTLEGRVAIETVQSGPWQKSYTTGATLGSQDTVQGRGSLLWKPNDSFKALLTMSGSVNQSDTQAGQFYIYHRRGTGNIPAGYINYPTAPSDDQAADWSSCVRTTYSLTSGCVGYQENNRFVMGSLRLDYDIGNDVILTSLTSLQQFDRYEPRDSDGTTYENLHTFMRGHLDTIFQELRAAGKFQGDGHWIVGSNYEKDYTADSYLETFDQGSSNPIFGYLPLNDTTPSTHERITTYSFFGNTSYPIMDTLNVEGGVRYTKNDRNFEGCSLDSGDGQWASVAQAVSNYVLAGNPVSGPAPNFGPGSCGTINGAPTHLAGLYTASLDQNNISWRVGADWNATRTTLLYANISKGYKAGSFPTLGAAANSQFAPVVQEELLAYEAGFKSRLIDTLQLNGAAFYYDYKNKQILGDILDPVFGGLNALVNIPKSRVIGFELSATWRPVPGLTISPSVSNQNSKIEGHFVNYNAFGQLGNFSGEPFPYAPDWQADIDVEYEWPLMNDYTAFVGANLNFQDRTNASLGQTKEYAIPAYTLLDLRAGVENGPWKVQIWSHNVTDEYYVTTAFWGADAVVRYTGKPVTFGGTLSYRY